ncbi:hypothetical protein [Thiomicrorhabdus sp. Milos-T2]|uniref:hypothetical protein n=1 Tax=Thiomicrorhabdus sp. Milos-T2 TaxID=90814 RepID=UPI00049402D2|nr:hypothetical protein [Thiomicrorhabdus sp. Milos-T2]
MKTKRIIPNYAPWIPLDKRISFPPRKPELRRPLLWLAREGDELFLVNETDEILDSVIVQKGGFQTVDDEAFTLSSDEFYDYKNVNPHDAVKVDEYDGLYDLDFMIQVHIKVKSRGLGCLEITSPAEKGGVKETVLIWDTNESGKYVNVSNCEALPA